MNIKNINFGIKDGKLVEISQVPKGLDCGCICPSCGSKLIAKKGNKRKHHFSHYKVRECEGYLETVLHLTAKEILLNSREIVLPIYNVRDGDYSNDRSFSYRGVIAEKKVEDIIPDIQLEFNNGNKVFVEIRVTHEVDDIKLEKLRNIGISTLEIDLSTLKFEDEVFELKDLEKVILEENDLKKWVYDRQEKKNKAKRKKYLEDLRIAEERRKVKEKEEGERKRKYRMEEYHKGHSSGYLWLNEDESLGGYVFYEEKEYPVRFKETYSIKPNAPKYIMSCKAIGKIWDKRYGLGALWEKEDGKLNGHISIGAKKYIVVLAENKSKLQNKIYFSIKVKKISPVDLQQKKTTKTTSLKEQEKTSLSISEVINIDSNPQYGLCFICCQYTWQWYEFNKEKGRGCCKECADNLKNK